MENRELRAGGKLSTSTFRQDGLTYRIIGAAMTVHSVLGPGLFESIYENALCLEFDRRDICYRRQKRFRVNYEGIDVGEMVADLVVENQVLVELKSVSELSSVHEAQTIAYLRASGIKRGLLNNFNVTRLKSGIRRYSR